MRRAELVQLVQSSVDSRARADFDVIRAELLALVEAAFPIIANPPWRYEFQTRGTDGCWRSITAHQALAYYDQGRPVRRRKVTDWSEGVADDHAPGRRALEAS